MTSIGEGSLDHLHIHLSLLSIIGKESSQVDNIVIASKGSMTLDIKALA
jgi:hypothetical protein